MVDGSGRNIDLVQPLQFFRLQGDSLADRGQSFHLGTSFPEISARALEISRPRFDRFWTTPSTEIPSTACCISAWRSLASSWVFESVFSFCSAASSTTLLNSFSTSGFDRRARLITALGMV